MTTIAQRVPVARPLALIPRGFLLLIALGLIIALTVAGLVVGGRLAFTQAVLPAPVTGPAANGLIAFERDGDICGRRARRQRRATPHRRPGDRCPTRAGLATGTRIAYLSSVTEGAPVDVIVANADGTDPVYGRDRHH